MASTVAGSPNPSPDTSMVVLPPNPMRGAHDDGLAEGDMETEGVTEGVKLGLLVSDTDVVAVLLAVRDGEGVLDVVGVGLAVAVNDLEGEDKGDAVLVLEGMDMVADQDRDGLRVREGVRDGTPKLSNVDSVGLGEGVIVSDGVSEALAEGEAELVSDLLGVTLAVRVGDGVMLMVGVMERYNGSTSSAVVAG